MNWEVRFYINTLPCVKQTTSGNVLDSTGSSASCSVMTQMGENGEWWEALEGTDMCIYVYIADDAFLGIAETNTTL